MFEVVFVFSMIRSFQEKVDVKVMQGVLIVLMKGTEECVKQIRN